MGAYSPAPLITKSLEKKIIERIINPTLSAMKKKGHPYNGFLYAGLMIVKNEPFLIEYNIRMGDPECQVILPRLKTDLVTIIKNTINNKLKNTKITWSNSKSMTIVLCSKGYPGKYKKNKKINNLFNIKLTNSEYIYHAGTKFINNELVSNGGRVLNITSKGSNFRNIRKNILKIIKKINWKYGFYRKDIGWRIINK
jgi:phosphoribosylamine--glycine ligase